jgi:quercetin dioxygenase-like cupin family protein
MSQLLSKVLHRDQRRAILSTVSANLLRPTSRDTCVGTNTMQLQHLCQVGRKSRAQAWMNVVAVVGVLCSSAAFSQEKSPPQVTEKARLVLPQNVQWESCSPEGAKPEEECEYSVLSGDTKKGASGMYVHLPNGCASPKHWHTSPMHLVGLEGEFIYIFEDGTESSLTPGAYVFLPGGKVHSERCGAEGALFYLYFEKPVDEHRVAEK